MRMQLRRFTRLMNAFSKKLSHLKAAVALHFAHYNLCRVAWQPTSNACDAERYRGSYMVNCGATCLMGYPQRRTAVRSGRTALSAVPVRQKGEPLVPSSSCWGRITAF